MKPGALILGIFVSAALSAAAGVLYVLSPENAARHYRESVDFVRQIQLLSADWSVDLARVRSDPLADFDSLAAFVPRMEVLKTGLRDSVRRIPDFPDRLAGDVGAYLSTVEAKEERIERFKTGYAVVRNSARYLPLATANVTEQAREAGNERLAASVSALAADINQYLALPNDADQTRLAEELQRMLRASVAHPPPLANALANLLSHAEVLLARQGPTEALFLSATSDEISTLTDRLADDLEFEIGRRETLAVWYERGVLAVIGGLALFWVLLAVQQRRRGRMAPAAHPPAAAAREAPRPARDAGSKAPQGQRAPEPEPAPAAVAPVPPPAVPAAVSTPARAAPPTLNAEKAMAQGFVAECVADNLADLADRISVGMSQLRHTQEKMRSALQSGDITLDSLDGAAFDEEIVTASVIASSARREANAIADLAKRLAVFSQKPNGLDRRGMVDVNACIDEVVEAVGVETAATVVRKPGNIPDVFASKIELRLMLMKIIENAMTAVETVENTKSAIMIDTARKDDEILITVIDNGVGIPLERSKNIFKPFYTSRDGAMGVGLTLADRLARKNNGSIRINSLTGQGTVARITLPAGASGS